MSIAAIGSQSLLQPSLVAQTKQNGDFAEQLAKASAKAEQAAKSNKEDAKLKNACQEMEAVFLNMMLSEMRKSVPKGGLFAESNGEDIMRSMLDSELTKNMARAGGMGLADMLYRQMKTPEAANKNQAPK